MSPRLALHLLGPPQIYLENEPITLERRKALALLAYLAVEQGGHSRESLSALLWPDYSQSNAFKNLRQILWEIQKTVSEGLLITAREKISLDSSAERVGLDVREFESLFAEVCAQNDTSLRIPFLTDSVKLYRNHFLTGFSLKDAHPFNDWAFAESEDLRQKFFTILSKLSEDYCAIDQAAQAIPHARRLVTLDPLNESAHRQLMEVYLQAGQHSAALKQYQTCEQILRKELGIDPQPETRDLYKKIRKREIKPVQIEKRKDLGVPQHNLPLQLSTFIGREKEQKAVVRLITSNRLVALIGAGGIGKTRLSLKVGEQLLSDFAHGVWFVELASLNDPSLVPQAISTLFGIVERSENTISEKLVHFLQSKTALLILDNCEHVLTACVELAEILLKSCPNLKILALATSRESLGIPGEALYRVPSLSVAKVKPEWDQLADYESVRLFTNRAQLAAIDFSPMMESIPTIAQICRRLDGIPLAIELAAARANMLKVEEILKQLNDAFAILAGDGRGTLPRHETLQSSMDWSWSLLTEFEKMFLRQLSVFAGGWTIESAQAVCEGNTLLLIGALVKKSLMTVDQKIEVDTRYHFHEIVRHYTLKRLIEAGEENNIRTQHLNYFLRLSEKAESALSGPEQRQWQVRLRDERDNLRAALAWAESTDLEAGLYLAARLDRFWENFDMREGVRWLTEFIQKPESKNYPLAKAKVLLIYGRMLGWMQQHTQARSAAQACLELFRAHGNRQGEIDSLLLLAYVGTVRDQPKQLRQQALALAQALNDIPRQAWALFQLGWRYSGDKRYAYWEQALTLMDQARDWGLLEMLLSYTGNFYILNGNLELAQKRLQEAERLNAQLQDKGIEVDLLFARGRMAMIQGDYPRTHAYWRKLLEIAEEVGVRVASLWCHSLLGYLALREGDLSQAREIFKEMTGEFFNDKNEIGVVFNLEGMAGLSIAIGKLETAARLIGWADATHPLLEQANIDKIIAACLAKIGEVKFSDAYEMGEKMTLEEAVASALRS